MDTHTAGDTWLAQPWISVQAILFVANVRVHATLKLTSCLQASAATSEPKLFSVPGFRKQILT